jgi:hypothetical protein
METDCINRSIVLSRGILSVGDATATMQQLTCQFKYKTGLLKSSGSWCAAAYAGAGINLSWH